MLTTPPDELLNVGWKPLVATTVFRLLRNSPALLKVPTPMMWVSLYEAMILKMPPVLLLNTAVPPLVVSSISKYDKVPEFGVKVTVP